MWSTSAFLFQITEGRWIFRFTENLFQNYSFLLRGAPISDKERRELNLKAGGLLKKLGIDTYDSYGMSMMRFEKLAGSDMLIITWKNVGMNPN